MGLFPPPSAERGNSEAQFSHLAPSTAEVVDVDVGGVVEEPEFNLEDALCVHIVVLIKRTARVWVQARSSVLLF